MAKLRNIQIFRNGTPAESLAAAKTAILGQLSNLKDGELILGRYNATFGTTTSVHAVIGIAHVPATGTASMEYVYCGDENTKEIQNAINALDNIGEIMASVDNEVVTIYKSVTETNGIIDIDNTEANAIVLAKVAKTGEAVDVKTSTITPATYNVTSGETSATWNTVVADNALSTTGDVEDSLGKLDKKIAGLADELIADELVIKNSFAAVQTTVGMDENFALDGLNEGETSAFTTDTDTVVEALNALDDKLAQTTGSSVNDVKINGTTIVDDHIASIAVDGTYNATSNKIASQTTVSTAIEALDAEVTSTDGTNVQVKVTEVDGKITAVNVTDNTDANLKLHLFKTADGAAATTVSADGVEYALQQGGTTYDATKVVAKFNIEKDSFVRDGSVVSGTWNGSTFTEDAAGTDHALKLEIRCTDEAGATTEKTVYININDLYDNVTYTISWSTEEGHTDEIKLTPSKGDAQYIKAVKSFKATGDNYITVTPTTATSGDVEMTVTHKASGVTAGSYGESATALKNYAETINVPRITVDAAGHITAASDSVITLPSKQTASDALTIAVADNVATISDTFTLDSTEQTATTVTLTGEKDIQIVANGTNGAKIGHSTTYAGTTATGNVTFTDAALAQTLSVPVLTIDTYGHVTANAQTTYTITLPESIATAVQTVLGDTTTNDQRTTALNNNEYVNVTAVRAENSNDVKLQSSVKTQEIASATTDANGLATALDVRNTIEGLDATVASETIAEGGTQATTVLTTITEVDGKLTSVTNSVLGADVTYTAATEGAAANLAAANSTGAVLGSDVAAIKSYVDAKSSASTTQVTSTSEDGITVSSSTGANGQTIYDVKLELASKMSENGEASTTAGDNLLKVVTEDNVKKLTIENTWDCGTF